jgi:hypothetical protein
MHKTLTFSVEITFADKITDDNQIIEIAQNIADAVKQQAQHGNIVSEDSDTYSEIVRVTPQYINLTIIEHII